MAWKISALSYQFNDWVRSIFLFVWRLGWEICMVVCRKDLCVCCRNRSISCNTLIGKQGSKRTLESERPSLPPHSGLIHAYIVICSHLPFLFSDNSIISPGKIFSELRYCYQKILLILNRLLKVASFTISYIQVRVRWPQCHRRWCKVLTYQLCLIH